MAVYGTDEGVRQLLRNAAGSTLSADQDARIVAARRKASTWVERETGAVFGGDATATIVVEADGGDTLWLPVAVRTVTSLTEGPTWDGAAWTGGTLLAASAWRLAAPTATGHWREIVREGGIWSGRVVVVGKWETDTAMVPTEIADVVHYLAAEIVKREDAGPAGAQGPDGSVVPLRDPFRDPEVRAVVARYRVGRGVLVA